MRNYDSIRHVKGESYFIDDLRIPEGTLYVCPGLSAMTSTFIVPGTITPFSTLLPGTTMPLSVLKISPSGVWNLVVAIRTWGAVPYSLKTVIIPRAF